MRLRIKYVIFLFATVAMACGGPDSGNSDRLQVVTTIYPLEYMATRIGGDDVEARVLVGQGAEAHTFEPTASDVQAISSAKLIVANGLGLEPWLDRIINGIAEADRPVVIEASDIAGFEPLSGIDEHEEREGEHHDDEVHEEDHHDEGEGHEHEIDPHVWLDPVRAQRQVERIRDAMIEADLDAAEGYRERAQQLVDELAAIHQEYSMGLASCTHDHFLTTHAAYAYMAARYGLEQLSISGVTLEAEPTPRDLAELSARVEELGLSHVMVEPVGSQRLAGTIAAEVGLEFLEIHQMESVTAEELAVHGDYIGLMRNNLANLQVALGCSG